jgi:hypothetical protein
MDIETAKKIELLRDQPVYLEVSDYEKIIDFCVAELSRGVNINPRTFKLLELIHSGKLRKCSNAELP